MMPLFQSKIEQAEGTADHGSLAEESLHPIAKKLGVPRRNMDRAKQIVLAQRRFFNINRKGYRVGSLVNKPYFPEALDLFQIHGYAHPEDLHLYNKWKRISSGAPREQKPRKGRPPRKRKQQRRRPAGGQPAKAPAEQSSQTKKGL
jgi:hypothetical protein